MILFLRNFNPSVFIYFCNGQYITKYGEHVFFSDHERFPLYVPLINDTFDNFIIGKLFMGFTIVITIKWV